MRLSQKDLYEIAVSCALGQGVDSNLVCAIITTESGWDQWATRFEPQYRWTQKNLTDIADSLGITRETEEVLEKTSFGLMQIMGSLARDMGFMDQIPMILDPVVNITLGCKYLKRLAQRYHEECEVIAAYNAGSARRTPGGMLVNQRYLDKVYSHLLKLRALK